MIVYLLTQPALYTMGDSLPRFPEDLRSRIRVLTYGELFRARELPVATYIFSDVERLTAPALAMAAKVWAALERSRRPVRLLNHPIRAMRRFELLRKLHEQGINSFNVHRWTGDRSSIRYPVFLRGENDHVGARTRLILDPGILERRARELRDSGMNPEEILIVEFCQTRDARGLYRKYGVFNFDGRLLATHIYFGANWMVKTVRDRLSELPQIQEDELIAEELEYLAAEPHRQQIREIFATARIEYGRIDYGLFEGRLQVWEINTNPNPHLGALSPEIMDSPRGRRILPQILEGYFDHFRSLDTVADPVQIPVNFAA